jgi:hypothetical protein
MSAVLFVCFLGLGLIVSNSSTGDSVNQDMFVANYFQGIVDADSRAVRKFEYSYKTIEDIDNNEAEVSKRQSYFWIDDLISFRILEKTSVNENLTAYKMHLTANDEHNQELELCYFVVKEDGQYYITESPYIIPDRLRGDTDLLKYIRNYNDARIDIAQPAVLAP